MKKLLFTAAVGLALTGCENMGTMSNDMSPNQRIDVKNQTVEARAQACANRGFRPGSRKFKLCFERSAENAVTNAPTPKRKPFAPATKQAGN